MNNLKLSSDIQYFIDEKFRPNNINSICVGKIINKAKKQKYSSRSEDLYCSTPKNRQQTMITYENR